MLAHWEKVLDILVYVQGILNCRLSLGIVFEHCLIVNTYGQTLGVKQTRLAYLLRMDCEASYLDSRGR